MSRIGRRPIAIPAGVTIDLDGPRITVRGPKGELQRTLPAAIRVRVDDGHVVVERPSEAKPHRELHGLTRTLVANMVEGVTSGYRKTLEISGVGYRAQKIGEKLQLSLGYSHPVDVEAPDGITFELETPTRLAVVGIDKELVGQIAAEVRAKRKPEPYKGKGVRYLGEQIRRKAGKTGKIGGKK
uniref:Large ribosomal subunit protein uL6 n=2 Tax=environmental samples TaxID=58229 RepID=A0A0H4TVW7_9CHLR|nr:50S ribosomal protein L6, large subunit ribosomal protein L6 [uncultured Chloroflexi bacterium Rifle_16ft_4_minimus_899]AKQ05064.1 50S ribosomal protein L6, large subunit ribosomal protein L6 [uncultured Chloroflexi bacterium Rifle_16ft_4_minimus_27880]